MYNVYVIQNEKQEFYIGYSTNLERRLAEHNAGENHSTRGHEWHLVYYEAYISEWYAREREQVLKKNRRMKTFLLERVRKSLNYLVVR